MTVTLFEPVPAVWPKPVGFAFADAHAGLWECEVPCRSVSGSPNWGVFPSAEPAGKGLYSPSRASNLRGDTDGIAERRDSQSRQGECKGECSGSDHRAVRK